METNRKIEELFDRWVNVSHNPNPTPAQKAAITKAWNRFAKAAEEAGRNPYELSEELSRP